VAAWSYGAKTGAAPEPLCVCLSIATDCSTVFAVLSHILKHVLLPRYASLERYIAFLVVFHQMAASVAAFTPLAFDISRSQSQLRVATTAAPISAAELEKEWAADSAGLGHFFGPGCEILPDPTVHVSSLGVRKG
jgi:hypothetical protein